MLRTLVLTLNHSVGGDVRDAHGGIGCVDMLPAGTGGSIGVDAQILVLDLYFDILVNFGINEKRSK